MPLNMRLILYLCLWMFYPLVAGAQSDVLRVMSFNIRYDNPADGDNNWHQRKAAIVDLCITQQPAVIGMQEALIHQVQYLDSALSNYRYIGVGRDDGKYAGEFSPIFYDTTRYTVLASGTFWLSPTPEYPSKGWDAALPRICTYAFLQQLGTAEKYWVFNTHFDHVGDTARLNSALLILQHMLPVLNMQNDPVIIMGDLNAEPNTQCYQQFATAMRDGRSSATAGAHGPEGTFNGFDVHPAAMKRIDYIFTTGFTVLEQWHLDNRRSNGLWLSDHFPVQADLQFH